MSGRSRQAITRGWKPSLPPSLPPISYYFFTQQVSINPSHVYRSVAEEIHQARSRPPPLDLSGPLLVDKPLDYNGLDALVVPGESLCSHLGVVHSIEVTFFYAHRLRHAEGYDRREEGGRVVIVPNYVKQISFSSNGSDARDLLQGTELHKLPTSRGTPILFDSMQQAVIG